MIEISITVSNEEKKLVKRELLYSDSLTLSRSDPYLQDIVNQAVSSFPGEVDDVKIRANFIW